MRRTGGAKCGAALTRKQLHGVARVEANYWEYRICAASSASVRDGVKRENGGGGIRTPETVSRLTVFKTVAFSRSATPPSLA